jgi:hypothetical protein
MIGLSSGSSLQKFDRVADRVRHHRQATNKPLILVEGPDDLLTLRPVLMGVDIFPANGKKNALAASVTLAEWKVERFACVVDQDLEGQSGPPELGDRYHPYLEADLEAMLIVMGVLEHLLSHEGSTEKLQRLGGAGPLVETLCRNVGAVTRLRQENATRNWGLSFDEVDLASKINRDTLELKVTSYCSALWRTRSTDEVTLGTLLDVAKKDPIGPNKFRGKDVMAVASVALRSKAGTLSHAATSEKIESAHLRSSSGLHLSKSEWLHGLRDVISQ